MKRLTTGAVRFSVKVQPRSSRNDIDGVFGAALKVRLTAPPVNGEANAALVEFLADSLDVARSSVRIVMGITSRLKAVEVDGVPIEAVERLAH